MTADLSAYLDAVQGRADDVRALNIAWPNNDYAMTALLASVRDVPAMVAVLREIEARLHGLIGATARNGHRPEGISTEYFEGYVQARHEMNDDLRRIYAALSSLTPDTPRSETP